MLDHLTLCSLLQATCEAQYTVDRQHSALQPPVFSVIFTECNDQILPSDLVSVPLSGGG